MAASLWQTMRMDNNSKRDSKRTQRSWTVPTEICFRTRWLETSRLIQMLNSNLWVSVISKIRLHRPHLQQVDNERSKQIRLMLMSYKGQHRHKATPNHKQPKKLEAVEAQKSIASALGQITMLELLELAHSTTGNSNSRTKVNSETLNLASLAQQWAPRWASAPATTDSSLEQQT